MILTPAWFQGRRAAADFIEAAVNVGVPFNSQIFEPSGPKSLKTTDLWKTESQDAEMMGDPLLMLPENATNQSVIKVSDENINFATQ